MQKPLSRLEKFLYALYSLDSSELPNPLSRLEVLLNCLVTGETPPAFEPLSRNEKYLMAISGSYHDELPNPISRGEKLLYKLATGDDSIDDIGEALSRYEELLSYIVENGCLDGPIDVEYVTYVLMSGQNTLYNTAKKPVKSAILKGQTLVNLSPNKSVDYTTSAVFSYTQLFKFDTIYTIIYDVIANDNNAHIMVDNIKTEFYDTEMGSYYVDSSVGHHQMTFTYLGKYDGFNWWVNQYDSRVIIDNIIILEGDYTNVDIPYFEGMQSVKMPVLRTTGKNLIDINTLPIGERGNCEIINGIVYKKPAAEYEATRWVVPVKPNTTYTISAKGSTGTVQISNFLQSTNPSIDSGFNLHEGGSSATFTTSSHTELTLSIFNFKVVNFEVSDIQLEYGTQATPYEPYKSNILTVNEDVTLRGVGEVKDELNLLTCELTQRIGEIVLDGSENWGTFQQGRYYIENTLNNINRPYTYSVNFKCDKLTPITYNEEYSGTLGIVLYENTNYDFIVRTDIQTIGEFKQWLSNNPTTVQYQLKTESVKTVDLSVVDQDGNEAELSSFEDITYVTLSSEGLIPEAMLEVATKNEEVLNTMSLRMDDISTTQANLNETVNTQSENVDATMIATTEIYEGLL